MRFESLYLNLIVQFSQIHITFVTTAVQSSGRIVITAMRICVVNLTLMHILCYQVSISIMQEWGEHNKVEVSTGSSSFLARSVPYFAFDVGQRYIFVWPCLQIVINDMKNLSLPVINLSCTIISVINICINVLLMQFSRCVFCFSLMKGKKQTMHPSQCEYCQLCSC